MARSRSLPFVPHLPAVKSAFLLYSQRGGLRITKWPRKRGTPKSPVVRAINARFASAIKTIKYVDASQWDAANKMVAGTGLYPRDVLMKAMTAGWLELVQPNGTSIKLARPEIFTVTYQGARVQRTTGQSIPSNTLTTIAWQTPIIDTATIWSASNPTRLTVPTGVSRVSLRAGITTTAIGATDVGFQRIRRNNGENVALTQYGTGGVNAVMDSGPLNVSPGDYFECQAQCSNAHTTNTGPNVYFAMDILTAVG